MNHIAINSIFQKLRLKIKKMIRNKNCWNLKICKYTIKFLNINKLLLN